MSNSYNNFGVANTPIGVPTTEYGPFGVVNSSQSGLSTIPNIVTDSVSPTALNSGVLSGNINSANYVTGVSGWAIKADGSAEFQNITGLAFSGISINGSTITGGTIRTAASGQRLVIDNANLLTFYDSSGSVVASMAPGVSSDFLIFAGTPPLFNGYQFSQTAFSSNPSSSNLGSTSFPWGNVYALKYYLATNVFISSGAGSPQGVVTASVGSLYLNTSGGANTTLYIKESGTNSNTGWVAK